MESQRERIYHRREHQVLGKISDTYAEMAILIRLYVGAAVPNATKLPEFTLDPEFMFGISTKEGKPLVLLILVGHCSLCH
jgi:hypothetical protein